jgi:hypothetical protein
MVNTPKKSRIITWLATHPHTSIVNPHKIAADCHSRYISQSDVIASLKIIGAERIESYQWRNPYSKDDL